MPVIKLPINTPAYKNVDSASLQNASDVLLDGYVDESSSTRRRPGLSEFVDLGTSTAIDGLFFWQSRDVVIAVSGGVIYSISEDGSFVAVPGATLNTGTRVIFAQHGNSLILANGGNMVIIGGSSATTITGTGVPNNVTHVAFIDQYIIAEEANTKIFHFSDVGTPESWNPLSFAAPVVKPDIINAIHTTAHGEILFFGPESLEVYINDAVNPFSPLQGAQSTRGCIAPYTVTPVGETFFYLDMSKKLVFLNEKRQAQTIDTPISRGIQEFATVSDAYAFYIEISGRSFFVVTFPTEKQTWVYDRVLNSWARWGFWNSATSSYDHWLVGTYTNATVWNKHIGGDRKLTGKVFEIKSDNLDDDGSMIRFFRRTGHITHGTHFRKRSNKLSFKVKSGIGSSDATSPSLMVKWRDDNGEFWANERLISLKAVGDSEFFAEIYNLGMYRARQYEVSLSDDTPLVLSDVEETFEVMRS